MKHIFKSILTLAAVALLSGCARELNESRTSFGDSIPVSFKLTTDGVATKAFSDGLSADGLLVGLYNKQGEGDAATYTYLADLSVTSFTGEKAVPVSGKAAVFETNLVRGQNYVLVFWAQKASSTAYTVDFANKNLTVSTEGDANDESRDAFYKVFETGVISETNFQFSNIILTRPFAQINVLAPNEDVTAAALSKVLFSKSAMTVKKAPKTMNLLTGAVGDFTATYTYSGSAITETAFGSYSDTHTYIAMNYVLGDTEKKLYDVAIDVYSTVNGTEQSPIHFDVNSAPAQRNYRTNIIGNVFTLDTQFNIIIDPIYNEPDYSEGLPGVEFEPTTITPTVPSTLPEGVAVAPGTTATEPSTITFAAGTTNGITIPVSASSDADIHARTSNAAVATAAVSGKNVTISPVSPGEATITIYTDPVLATKADSTKNYAGAKYEYKVVVEAPAEKLDVTISINDINLKVGEGCELEPDVDPEELYTVIVATPAEGYAEYFDWDADNWIIEAKKATPAEGIAITLSYPGDDTYKEASKTIKVYISEKPVPEVLFENITVTVDQEDALTYVVDDTLEASVTFDEGEQDIYDVYKLGEVWKIKGLKRGTAELTLKVAETATTAPTSVTVTVTSNGKTPTFVTEDQVEINVGDVKQITKEEDYDLDSDGTLTFSVAEAYASILTCTSSGQIKGLAEGTAKVTISVAASDTFEAGSADLEVKVNPAPVVEPVTSTITIEGVPTTAQEPGATFDVTITTNSSAPLVVSASNGANVALKNGNVYTVTCASDLTADTEVTLTASVAAVENAYTAAEETKTFTVKKKPVPTSEYVKITSTADVTDGDYLIVYEGESAIAFNGAISDKLDVASNGIAVEIAENKISGTGTIDASIFVFEVVDGGFAIKSASGIYISGKSGSNMIVEGSDPVANTITISEGNAVIASNATSIMYNASSGQERFRFYKDGSTQKAVALYKKVGSGTGAVPTVKEEPTLTIGGTIPTAAMAKDETFDFTVSTNSTGAITVALAPEGAASVAAKSGADKTWTVTAGEPNAETTVTLTVSVAATDTYRAKSATATFKVAKKPGDTPENIITATVAEFLAAEESSSQKYQLTGTVAKHNGSVNTQYGNFDLVDASGTVYVYGLTATEKALTINTDGTFKGNNDKSYASLGVEEGDVVTIIGYRGSFNNEIEVIGAYYVSHQGDTTPKFSAVINSDATVAAAGGARTITVTGNVAWTATATNGATLSAESGEGAGTITVTIPANSSETVAPSYTITVSTTADVATKSYPFTINQAKYVVPSGDETVQSVDQTYLAANKEGVIGDITYVNDTDYGSNVVTELRVYKGKTLTFTIPDGKTLTKVIFTCTANGTTKQGPGCFGDGAPDGYTYETNGKTGTWTGSATGSLSFTAANDQVRIVAIEVTYN